MVSGDSTLVGQLNDLLRDAAERLADMAEDMFVFTYADEAELYWTYSKEQTFYDIPLDKFGGRSSLGKCYATVVKHMATLGVDIADAVLVRLFPTVRQRTTTSVPWRNLTPNTRRCV